MRRFGVIFLCCLSTSFLKESFGKLFEKHLRIGTEHTNIACDKNDLENQGYSINDCLSDVPDSVYVQHDGICNIIDVHSNSTVTKRCVDGEWIYSGTSIARPLGRRGITTVIGLGIVVGLGLACSLLCGKEKTTTVYVQKYPPRFTSNCPPGDLLEEYVAQAGTDSAKVRWTDPSATDDGTIQSIQVTGNKTGDFYKGTPTGHQHMIIYEARDDDNLIATCFFSFTVKVLTCNGLLWPENGYRNCTNDNTLGSTCVYGCNTGYSLSQDINKVTCENTSSGPAWTTIPTCEKLACGKPPEVVNGNWTCMDRNLSYGSYCVVSCEDGFRLNGQVYTRCKADGNWSTPSTCTDDTPPELSCTTPQVFFADSGSMFTSVIWEEPAVTDDVDPYPTVRQTYGPDPGVSVEAGTSEFVQYIATDSSGNESPQCTIELRVLEVSCDHPLDTLEDPRLRFQCTMSTYTLGDNCTLDCDLNLPLEGSELITCEVDNSVSGRPRGYWDWNGEKPFCKEIACPDLGPPKNGALVYDTINTRPVSVMLCNIKFDIPNDVTNFNGIFLCLDSGTWLPNYTKAPDCIEPFKSRGFRLPSILFYYNGTCGVDDNIWERFKDMIADLNNIFPTLCPPSVTCTAVNPRIDCDETDRKKRSTNDPLKLLFDIQTDFTDFNSTGMSNDEIYEFVDEIQLNILKPVVQEKVNNGTFDIPAWTLEEDSFQTDEYGDWYCDSGYSRSGNTNMCKPCSLGRYERKGICKVCPIGKYSNTTGSVACTKCPDGYSTRHEASEYPDNCTKLCSPGSYSPDTFAPCAHCKVGFYQTRSGQTSCTACPTGKTTTTTGSKTAADCQYFDVLIVNTGGRIPVAESTINDITIMFWIKKASAVGDVNAVVSIEDLFDIMITDSIKVNYTSESPLLHDVGPLKSEAWVHVTVSLAVTNSRLSAYYNGMKVVSSQSVPTANDKMVLTITSTTNTGIRLSGLRLLDRVISDADVYKAAETCHVSGEDEIVNMEHFKNISKFNINTTTPSQCDAINGCENSPCGSHKCKDEINGFTCVCQYGWSGPTCSTPPEFCINNDCTNGATCVSGLTDYTCKCPPGYTGVFCETPPVDGAWSVWSAWSDCTTSCNSGSQQRTRVCDSPAAGQNGKDCGGEASETKSCNTSPCPECPVLQRGFGNRLNCSTLQIMGSTSCTVTCKDGYVLPDGLQTDNYTCGVDTNYVWQPFANVPDCAKPSHVDRFKVYVSVNYTSQIHPDDEQAVKDAVSASVLGTECYNALTCETSVDINQSSVGTTNGSSLKLSLTIELTDPSDLQLDAFIANGTVSTSLQETIDAVNNLEATAVTINSSANLVFDVYIHDTLYTTDTSTLAFVGTASCPSGQVVAEVVCVECPTGTYQNDDHCSYCEKGTFQSQTGQSSCVSCPSGYSTITIGSHSSSDCSEQTITSPSTTADLTSTTIQTSTTDTPPTSRTSSSTFGVTNITVSNMTTITSTASLVTAVSSTTATTPKTTSIFTTITDVSTSSRRSSVEAVTNITASTLTPHTSSSSEVTSMTSNISSSIAGKTSTATITETTSSTVKSATSSSNSPISATASANTTKTASTPFTEESTTSRSSSSVSSVTSVSIGTTSTTPISSTAAITTSSISSSMSSVTSTSAATPTTSTTSATPSSTGTSKTSVSSSQVTSDKTTSQTESSTSTKSIRSTGTPTTFSSSSSSVEMTSTTLTPPLFLTTDYTAIYVGLPIGLVILLIAGVTATVLYRKRRRRSIAKDVLPTISSTRTVCFDDEFSKPKLHTEQSNA